MVIGLRRRLGFLSRPLELVPDEPELEPEIAPKPPEVEFAGYAEDCRIFGFWRHDAERLSDALNVFATALRGGQSVSAPAAPGR